MKCAECNKRLRKNYEGLICQKCVRNEDVRRKHGIFTAADFSLLNLSLDERRILFLWACGQDVSDYFQRYAMPSNAHRDADLLEPLNNPGNYLSHAVFHDRNMKTWAEPRSPI